VTWRAFVKALDHRCPRINPSLTEYLVVSQGTSGSVDIPRASFP
jgi:hypothetical protein